MDLQKKLTDLGFSQCSVLDEEAGLVRIRTSKGWDYQRFQTEAQVDKWAMFNDPEEDSADNS